MMDHLSLKGKLAVIVPEGVVSNASGAHVKVRKMLLEKGLWAVVSLPHGTFNPYTGIKTFIVFLDAEIAKKRSELLFLNIENVGMSLGAQPRPIVENDLPEATQILDEWKLGNTIKSKLVTCVEKSRIYSNKYHNLVIDRYQRSADRKETKWPMVELGEVLDYEQPTKYIVRSVDYKDEYDTPVLTAGKTFVLGHTNEKDGIFRDNLPVIIFDDFTTATKFVDFPFKVKSSAMKILHVKREKADPRYVFYVMQNIEFAFTEHKRFWISEYSKIKIPLPPLEVQKQVVAELTNEEDLIKKKGKEIAQLKESIKQRIEQIWSA
jgi:type I restriction-modification system DNA methylase subunit